MRGEILWRVLWLCVCVFFNNSHFMYRLQLFLFNFAHRRSSSGMFLILWNGGDRLICPLMLDLKTCKNPENVRKTQLGWRRGVMEVGMDETTQTQVKNGNIQGGGSRQWRFLWMGAIRHSMVVKEEYRWIMNQTYKTHAYIYISARGYNMSARGERHIGGRRTHKRRRGEWIDGQGAWNNDTVADCGTRRDAAMNDQLQDTPTVGWR